MFGVNYIFVHKTLIITEQFFISRTQCSKCARTKLVDVNTEWSSSNLS